MTSILPRFAPPAPEPVEIALGLSPAQLREVTNALDAIVLSGSPADVEPSLFHATRHAKTAESDAARERTDFALLDHAVTEHKPVLAICYGVQSLNVFLGGALVQDIPSAIHTKIEHAWAGHEGPELHHEGHSLGGRFSPGANGRARTQARGDSSHHQSVLQPGRNLRVVAHAPDGVIEAVEWTGDANWIMGVQWHPERMVAVDDLAQRCFASWPRRPPRAKRRYTRQHAALRQRSGCWFMQGFRFSDSSFQLLAVNF